MDYIGTVPVFAGPDGAVHADLGALDDDGVGELSPRQARRVSNLDERIERLSSRRQKMAGNFGGRFMEAGQATGREEVYSVLTAKGLIQRGEFAGLGNVTLAASGSGTLNQNMVRTIWIRNFVLESDTDGERLILVTQIQLAGIPVNVGSAGAPLRMFNSDATRFQDALFGGLGSSRTVQVGQNVQVSMTNVDAGATHAVLGGLIVDEVNPQVQTAAFEQIMLAAALGYSPCRGV